jgi:hypothetical protein
MTERVKQSGNELDIQGKASNAVGEPKHVWKALINEYLFRGGARTNKTPLCQWEK